MQIPDLLQQLRTPHDLFRVQHEELEKQVLLGGQIQFLTAPGCHVPEAVQLQVTIRQAIRTPRATSSE